MIKYGLFDESEQDILRKSVVFYAAIAAKKINKSFNTRAIDALSKHRIKTDLLPVLRCKDNFNLEVIKKLVKEYIGDLMILTKSEKEFLVRFENKDYVPELLFEDEDILARVKDHPMALWKTR